MNWSQFYLKPINGDMFDVPGMHSHVACCCNAACVISGARTPTNILWSSAGHIHSISSFIFFLVQLCCMRCTHVVFGTHTAVNCWATWPQNDNHDTSWKLSIITADALPPYRTSRSVLGYAPMSSLIAIEALARACTRFYNHNRHRSHSCFVYLARATQFGVPKIELYIR